MAHVSIPQVSLAEDFTAVITGAHAGLGFEVAKYFGLLGGRVILACQNETRARAAMLRIQADVMEMRGSVLELEKDDVDDDDTIGPSASERASVLDAPLRIEFMHLDLASLDSVSHFAAQYREKGYPLHVLFCNDAVIHIPRVQTEDGLEMHFQYNFLSHFLLTLLLLPAMQQHEADARVVLGSSTSHTSGSFDLKNMQGSAKNSYDSKKFYANSQLYMIMFMYALQRRLERTNVSVFSVHNGTIDTLVKKQPDDLSTWGSIYTVGRTLGKICRDTTKSVSNALSVSINPAFRSLRNSFFVKGLPLSTSQTAQNNKMQEVLWRYSIDKVEGYLTQDDVKHLSLSESQLEDLGIIPEQTPPARRR